MLGAVPAHRSAPASASWGAGAPGSYQLPGLKGGMKNGSSACRVAPDSRSQFAATSSSVSVSVTSDGDPANSPGRRESPKSANTRYLRAVSSSILPSSSAFWISEALVGSVGGGGGGPGWDGGSGVGGAGTPGVPPC